MGLNQSKGNMYSWVTHTWNTIKGKCPHDCSYCYMHRWGQQSAVRFDNGELKTDLGMNNTIFVGSSCDMFAQSIPLDWKLSTVEYCRRFDNTYLFQSKNPMGIQAWEDLFPKKSRICTTIETNRIYPQMGATPSPIRRALGLSYIKNFERYVTIEPIMDFDLIELVDIIRGCEPKQVNIGADTGGNGLPEPSKEKIMDLIAALKEFTVIDKKSNLKRIIGV